MNHAPLVSIIIVNWNGLRWLPDCFGSLKKQNYRNYEIIFVDNASHDSSVAWVRRYFPSTKIIINKENLGFADANNIGYRAAKGEFVLFLNNDTRVSKTFLRELVRVFETNHDVGGVQSKILLMDKPDTHDSVGSFLTPTGFLYHYGFGKKNLKKYDKQIDLYTAKGACMMFRKDVLDRVSVQGDIFDPDYFAYFEESDMCHRVWMAGYRIVYAYKSVIYHKMGATSKHMENAFIEYHSFKNRIRTYVKNFGPLWLLTFLPLHLMLCQMYAFMDLLRGKISLMMAIERAIVWNIRNLRETCMIRKYIQSHIRVVSDKQLSGKILKKPGIRYYWYSLTGTVTEY